MYSVDLAGKNAVVLGVANHRSIAWHIAQALHGAGARLYLTYQNERLGDGIQKLTADMDNVTLIECDVSEDANVEAAFNSISSDGSGVDILVHSIAFANREDLGGDFSKTGRDGFRIALEISAYSLIPVARYAAPLMPEGGAIVTLTFQASDRVFPATTLWERRRQRWKMR